MTDENDIRVAQQMGVLMTKLDNLETAVGNQARDIAAMKEMLAQARGGMTIVKLIFGGSLLAGLGAAIAVWRTVFDR